MLNEIQKTIFEYLDLNSIMLLILFFICVNPKNLYGICKLYYALEKHEPLPRIISDFPIHSTSMEDYLISREKINLFVSQSLKNTSCQLRLDTNDINNLYLCGESIDKYKSYKLNNISDPLFFLYKYVNKYFYFQILDNKILEKRIDYLSLRGVDGILTEITETRFITKNNLIMTNSNVIEWNNKKMGSNNDWNEDKFYNIKSYNPLLYGLFTCDLKFSSYDESQGKLVKSIIEKITTIEIANGYLTIKVER